MSYPDSEAIASLELAHQLFLTFGGDPLASIDTVIDQHPGFLLAYLFKAGYLTQVLETRVHPKLLETAAKAQMLAASANERELAHLRAISAWTNGDVMGATQEWENVLEKFPHDLLAMQLAHLTCVLFGEIKGQRDVVSKVLDEWNAGIEGYEFVLGFYSFGLEENFEFEKADETAMLSLAMRENNPYAVHTIAHVRDMQGQPARGLEFMYEHLDTWSASEFKVHLWWHTALMHLELQEFDEAIAIYDDQLRGAKGDPTRYEEFDATALLWRLKLLDVDVGRRWEDLADKWEPSAEDIVYAFNSIHAMMAFVAEGRNDAARRLLAACHRCVEQAIGADVTVAAIRTVGIPFCEAIDHFQEQRYAECVERLLPVRRHVEMIGGSYVQRDILERTLLEAAIRGEMHNQAVQISDERCERKETSPQQWLDRARAHKGAGKLDSAANASSTARKLLDEKAS